MFKDTQTMPTDAGAYPSGEKETRDKGCDLKRY